jgi:hypothetical protein
MVEVEMMLKLNKQPSLSKPKAVVTLPNDRWEMHIPNRPRDEEELVGNTDDNVQEVGICTVAFKGLVWYVQYMH